MADTTYSPPDPAAAPSVTGLVSGILADAQELLKQQIALAKAEIRSDLQKTKQAVGRQKRLRRNGAHNLINLITKFVAGGKC